MNEATTIPQALEKPEVKAIAERADELEAAYQGYVVETAQHYQDSAEHLKDIKAAQRRVKEVRTSITRPMDQAKKAVMDFFRPVADKLDNVEATIKRAMLDWQREEDRKAREAQRIAREKADREAKKLAEKAEREREAGRVAKAENLEERASSTVAEHRPSAAPKVAGISKRKVWDFEIVDKAAVPDQYKKIDAAKIRGVVNALKEDADIPGVRVFQTEQIAAGGR